jgi:hypothetical protein
MLHRKGKTKTKTKTKKPTHSIQWLRGGSWAVNPNTAIEYSWKLRAEEVCLRLCVGGNRQKSEMLIFQDRKCL